MVTPGSARLARRKERLPMTTTASTDEVLDLVRRWAAAQEQIGLDRALQATRADGRGRRFVAGQPATPAVGDLSPHRRCW
jgi:hypothetical protein